MQAVRIPDRRSGARTTKNADGLGDRAGSRAGEQRCVSRPALYLVSGSASPLIAIRLVTRRAISGSRTGLSRNRSTPPPPSLPFRLPRPIRLRTSLPVLGLAVTGGHEKLVAFSCKKRGFCPACGARRMAETAAHLVDCVIPRVPVRHWVLSFPIPLRVLFASHPQLLAPMLPIVHRVIGTFLIKRSNKRRKAS